MVGHTGNRGTLETERGRSEGQGHSQLCGVVFELSFILHTYRRKQKAKLEVEVVGKTSHSLPPAWIQ